MSDDNEQIELDLPGDLQGLPWATIITTQDDAARRVEAGEIEWHEDGAYRFKAQSDAESGTEGTRELQWLASIGQRMNHLGLNNAEHRVLCLLLFRAGQKTVAWPSQASIERDTGMGERTIRRATQALTEKGVLCIERTGRTNRYHIAIPAKMADQIGQNGRQTNKGTSCSTFGGEPELFGDDEFATSKPTDLFALALPEHLRTDTDVMLALGRFAQHRTESKKPLTPTAVKMIVRKISAHTSEDIVHAIEAAIECGWQGFFPKKGGAAAASAERPATRQPARTEPTKKFDKF
jgi:hypothetical protein